MNVLLIVCTWYIRKGKLAGRDGVFCAKLEPFLSFFERSVRSADVMSTMLLS